jgi:ABC-type transport system involved in cytochrome bd biosynthesis fused ATPase/permease subunit
VKRSLPVRLLQGFARFWWDFLVGDTPELFVAVVVTIGLVALLSLAGHLNVAAAIALPALVVAALVVSVWRARVR